MDHRFEVEHDAAEMADCETELVNVIERMSTKTATIRVGENDSKSLSFQGRPFTEQSSLAEDLVLTKFNLVSEQAA